jgi:hypothetical protein
MFKNERDLTGTNKITKMSLFEFTCAYGGNMIIIKPRFLKKTPRAPVAGSYTRAAPTIFLHTDSLLIYEVSEN